jgi:hypothetical protein
VFKARCRAGGAPSTEENDGLEPLRSRAHSPSKRRPPPGGFILHVGSPTRCKRREMAEDGDPDSQRRKAPTRFPAEADHLAGSSSEESG